MTDAKNSATHLALKNFDEMPDSAWRRVRSGQLIAPHDFGARTTRWKVGELRNALQGGAV